VVAVFRFAAGQRMYAKSATCSLEPQERANGVADRLHLQRERFRRVLYMAS